MVRDLRQTFPAGAREVDGARVLGAAPSSVGYVFQKDIVFIQSLGTLNAADMMVAVVALA